MKTKSLILTAIVAASLTTAGCDRVKKLIGGGEPSGQVVATVNGEEITGLELRQEMGNFSSRDPKIMKAAQDRALEGIIIRKLIVQEAKKQKLDKSAEYGLQVHRGEENLLVQLYQRKVSSAIAVPTRDSASTYIAANPPKFTSRRILIVDQVVAPPSKIPTAQFQAAKTLADVKALFQANNVPYQTNVAAIDTLSMDPRMLQQIEKLPADEVFVIPQGGGLLFNRIAETRDVPFGGDAAIAYATNALRTQKAQEAVVRQVELLRKSADKDITYNAAYKPTPAPKTAPAKSPSGAAAGSATAPAAPAPAVPAAKP